MTILALKNMIFYPYIFLMGSFVGSFLNVCIYRIPVGRKIYDGRSRCKCGQVVAWRDLVPVLSWLLLRGKTRCCQRPLSARYAIVETLTACLFLAYFLKESSLLFIPGTLLISLLIVISWIDWDHLMIPDSVNLGGLLLGLGCSILFPSLHLISPDRFPFPGIQSLGLSLLGAVIGSSVLLWIAIIAEFLLDKEAVGFGDVKLMGLMGSFLGWQGALFALFSGAMIGSVLLFPFMLLPKSSTLHIGRGKTVPFGPMLAAGALSYLFLDHARIKITLSQTLNLLYQAP